MAPSTNLKKVNLLDITDSTWARLESLREESRILEEKAGLTQKMEGAQCHPWPFDKKLTTKEYFEETEEWLHFETRSLYFSVSDTDLRKKLIATKRKVDAYYQLLLDENVIKAKHDVSVATNKIWYQSWLKAGIYGLVISIISCWMLGIKGLVLGIAFVIWFLTNERDEIKYELTEALERLRNSQEIKTEESNVPEVFSASEEQNGTEDKFDDSPSDLPRHYATGKLRN